MNQATSTNCIFTVTDLKQVKDKVLNWANRFSTFCFLDNHQYNLRSHSLECIAAVGVIDSIEAGAGNSLQRLQQFLNADRRWLFGHLGYDLKNEIENVETTQPDLVQFPDLFFFQPEIIVRFDNSRLTIESKSEDEEKIFDAIMTCDCDNKIKTYPANIRNRYEKKEYVAVVEKLREHILRGDCYEINFCQEFFAENSIIDPVAIYSNLSSLSPNPFSAFYKLEDKYLLCASPERFLKKLGRKILSQPIKGTARRMSAAVEDIKSRNELQQSTKDRSENVMIVDLVRNDLSKICTEGSVTVDELFEVYSFPQVHQMISTISGELSEHIRFSDIIRATFPMGSMTGAPKKKVLELIARYERTKRGIFSGALGYITPEGDFDFNVVIRSIMYNSAARYLSFQAGSAITFYSDPEKEWEECLLKVASIRKVLEATAE
ncbi:MAG TPA: anthranilate synthase component I family protein [Chitinophagaceae bacterium]